MREDLDLLNTFKVHINSKSHSTKNFDTGTNGAEISGKSFQKVWKLLKLQKGNHSTENSGNSQRKVKREKFLKIWGKQVLRISFSDIPPENAVPCIKENKLHQNFSSNEPPIDLGLSAGQGFCVVFLCKTLLIWLLHSLSQFVLGEVY